MGLLTPLEPLAAFPSGLPKAGLSGQYLGRVLQDGQQPLLDPPQQLRACAEAIRPQEAQGGGQVLAAQQGLLCRSKARTCSLLPSTPPPTNTYGASTKCQAELSRLMVLTHQEHICDPGPRVMGFRPERARQNEGEERKGAKAGALDNLSDRALVLGSPRRICRAFVCSSRFSVCCSTTSMYSVSWL